MNLSGVGVILASIADAPHFDLAARIAIMLAVLLVGGKLAAEAAIVSGSRPCSANW